MEYLRFDYEWLVDDLRDKLATEVGREFNKLRRNILNGRQWKTAKEKRRS